jgi:dephospho-CoA kinase
MTRDQAQRMLAAQVTREQRLAVADDVILNNGELAALRDQVEKLHRQYLMAARAQSDRVTT